MLHALIGLALTFDFLNGFHDSSNIVAAVIASRAMQPRLALLLAAAAHFAGPFLFGVAVATTVGEGLLDAAHVSISVVVSSLYAAVVWNLITCYLGIPSSSSHALIGVMLWVAIYSSGFGIVQIPGLLKILFALFFSPVLGLLSGFLALRCILRIVSSARPRINIGFRPMQIVTLTGLALSHGTNDAQKTMGVIAPGLVASGRLEKFHVPMWVIAISVAAIAAGTALGGWRLIRTLGGRIFKIRPVHGIASQLSGAAVILGAALVGGPVSTTQVMSSAIMGADAADHFNKVRWHVLGHMLIAWMLAIPAAALISALAYFLIGG